LTEIIAIKKSPQNIFWKNPLPAILNSGNSSKLNRIWNFAWSITSTGTAYSRNKANSLEELKKLVKAKIYIVTVRKCLAGGRNIASARIQPLQVSASLEWL
jgi:hypothetical protein